MASLTLYPVTIPAYQSAFVDDKCKVYFSLSKFNSSSDFVCVHATVKEQKTGKSVVNPGSAHPVVNNILLNIVPIYDAASGQYYFELAKTDILNGWTEGYLYKIQIRLSSVLYTPSSQTTGSAWLNNNGDKFSEWSTICITKKIGAITITIPEFNYDSSKTPEETENYVSSLDFKGSYSCKDSSETLYSYVVSLTRNGEMLEESNSILSIDNVIEYNFETILEEDYEYLITISYVTKNKYENKVEIPVTVTYYIENDLSIEIIPTDSLNELSYEEEEGLIGLKMYSSVQSTPYSGNIEIKRSSSATNFSIWDTIKVIPLKYAMINDQPKFYDYTAESGVYYKYGIQYVDKYGTKSQVFPSEKLVKREYNYSYLLGEDGVQLKLPFDYKMSNFKTKVNDGNTETIGSQFPIITRNGKIKYKVFPINGVISYNMDEAHMFLAKDFTYGYYQDSVIGHYDISYEKEFREKVLEFLYDDKPKLFKSPTERNMIIRITDVSCTPNTSLNRLIYNFSCMAYEIADATVDNYLKYNFIKLEDTISNFQVDEIRLGQFNGKVANGADLVNEILEMYGQQYEQSINGYSFTLSSLYNLRIMFNSFPEILDSGRAGYKILYNDNPIYIYGDTYQFDDSISLDFESDTIKIDMENGADVTLDYVYNVIIEPDVDTEKIIISKNIVEGVGQIAEVIEKDFDIYNYICNIYTLDHATSYQKVEKIYDLLINAPEGSQFEIGFAGAAGEVLTVNATEILELTDIDIISSIKYIGNENIYAIIDFTYRLSQGKYREV